MKILYLTTFSLPSHRANRTHVVKMCDALSNFAEVVLVLEKINGEIKEKYNLKNDFKKVEVGYGGHLKSLIYAWKLRGLLKKINPDFVYLRDHYLFLCVNILRFFGLLKTPKIIIDIHWVYDFNFITRAIDRFNIPRANFLVFLTDYIAYYYLKKFKLDYRKTIVWPNGVDLEMFENSLSKEEARKKLNLPLDKNIFYWNGASFREQGVDEGPLEILQAMAKVKDKNWLLCLVGGTEKEIQEYEIIAEKLGIGDQVRFTGFVEFNRLPDYSRAADFCLLCFPWTEHYAFHMCPRKLFDYLVSRAPIIASDLPCLRNILNENNCFFAKPGDANSLAEKIDDALHHKGEMRQKAQRALEDAKKYTWEKRVRAILDLISEK